MGFILNSLLIYSFTALSKREKSLLSSYKSNKVAKTDESDRAAAAVRLAGPACHAADLRLVLSHLLNSAHLTAKKPSENPTKLQ